MQKAIEANSGKPYKIPKNIKDFDDELTKIESDMHRNLIIIAESEKKIDEELSLFYNVSTVNGISLIEEYRVVLEKERNIYTTCNKMKNIGDNTLLT